MPGGEPVVTLPNGIVGEYAYDNASRLTSITYKQNGTTVLGDLTYEYDKNGNRIKTGGSFARTGIPQRRLHSLQRRQSSDNLRRQDSDLRQQRQSSNDHRLQRDDDLYVERSKSVDRHQRSGVNASSSTRARTQRKEEGQWKSDGISL